MLSKKSVGKIKRNCRKCGVGFLLRDLDKTALFFEQIKDCPKCLKIRDEALLERKEEFMGAVKEFLKRPVIKDILNA